MIPERMRVGVYYGPDDIRVEERPVPEIGPDEALVRTLACGLCAGEAMEWYSTKEGGKVLGHEPVGVVVAAGVDVDAVHVGDRVFVNHHVGRLQSHWAIRGHYTRDPFYAGNRLDPGGMAEYFRVSANHLRADVHVLPESIGDSVATTIEPWSCVLGGLKTCGVQPGDTVVVLGCGFMGLGFVHMAPLFGAGTVIAVDFSSWRRDKATELGATHVLDAADPDLASKVRSLNGGLLADVVVAAVPAISAWDSARTLVEPGGTVHLGAPTKPGTVWALDGFDAYFDEVTITSKYSADHRDTYQLIRLIESGRVNPLAAITHHFALDDLADGFRLLTEADESLKIVVYPHIHEEENDAR
ncbi:MAG: zinc-binding dehydrogenase [Actinobacteria bacterium]|nr:zinc-binding dehydrogenase [Actinomycetota bacterium]